ncbi:hypothetical protein [Streptomyces sp. NPDC047968]|uniref:hypothetical protein n=1 Tax=unclassified Streptomyces TaxID=2593676 RepID=UPI003420C62E
MTYDRARSVMFADPQPNTNGTITSSTRPSLGVELPTGELMWTVHTSAIGNHNNADSTLAEIARISNATPGREFAVLGDFNRIPERLTLPPNSGSVIYRPHVPTQNSGRELDYMVSNGGNLHGWTGSRIESRGVVGSTPDHYPVEFRIRAAGEDPATGYDPPFMWGKDLTKCLTRREDDNHVVLSHCDGSSAQNWSFHGKQLQNTIPGFGTQCLTLHNRGFIALYHDLETDACGPSAIHSWRHQDSGMLTLDPFNKHPGCVSPLVDGGPTLGVVVCDRNAAPPLERQWYVPGAAAYAVAVTKSRNVTVTRMMPSGQVMTTQDLGGSFTKAVAVFGNGGWQILALDTNRSLMKSTLDPASEKWSQWSSFHSSRWGVKDFSVSVSRGDLYVTSITTSSNILLARRTGASEGSLERNVQIVKPASWDRVSGVFIPDPEGEEVEGAGETSLGRLVLFIHESEGKMILKKTMRISSDGWSGDIEEPVPGAKDIESVTASLGNLGVKPVVHLEYASTSGHVYATTMDVQSEEWAGRYSDLGNVQLRDLNSTEVPGMLVLCGVSQDSIARCAQLNTFISGLPPAKWTEFGGPRVSDELAARMSGYVVSGIEVLARTTAITASLHFL